MTTTNAKILMAFIFIARGTSFLFSKTLMNSMSPLSVLAVRFILAFLVLTVVFYKKMIKCDKDSISGGLQMGIAYTICMFFEMYGLRKIDTGVASFIENMAIVLVPIYVAIFTRVMPKKKTILCATIAVIGVGCLSLTQNSGNGSFNYGIILAILAALTYGECILITDKVSKKGDPVTEGIIQLGVMGVLSLIGSLFTGDFSMPSTGNEWLMIMMLVLICSCFGFTFQPVAQKYLPAETAAMFSVVNPLTSCIMGIVIVHESHGPLKMFGCALILVAMVIYNMNTSKKEGTNE